MKDSAYKYRFEMQQAGKATIELFGRDTKMSNDQIEQYRRNINREHFTAYVVRMWLVNQKTGKVAASSRNSKLPAEPLFQVVS